MISVPTISALLDELMVKLLVGLSAASNQSPELGLGSIQSDYSHASNKFLILKAKRFSVLVSLCHGAAFSSTLSTCLKGSKSKPLLLLAGLSADLRGA